MELQKIQVKVNREGKDQWVHFCYVPGDIKERFDKEVNKEGMLTPHWILKWAVEDFGTDKLETWDDLERLKAQIKEKYKTEYPELYIESNTDNQGWLRVWYKNHMDKELKEIG